jgi:hypothetical protein
VLILQGLGCTKFVQDFGVLRLMSAVIASKAAHGVKTKMAPKRRFQKPEFPRKTLQGLGAWVKRKLQSAQLRESQWWLGRPASAAHFCSG